MVRKKHSVMAVKRGARGGLRRFTVIITREKRWHVAHCVELGVVSQGKTIEAAQTNLKEAVELFHESFRNG